eukprot:RCo034773
MPSSPRRLLNGRVACKILALQAAMNLIFVFYVYIYRYSVTPLDNTDSAHDEWKPTSHASPGDGLPELPFLFELPAPQMGPPPLPSFKPERGLPFPWDFSNGSCASVQGVAAEWVEAVAQRQH